MKLVSYACPGCGAHLNVDADLKQAVCPYCNNAFPIDDEVRYVKLDGAAQAGYEFEKGRQQAQVEFTQQQSQQMDANAHAETPKKRKTLLWVLGWIFIFPVPLTVLMLKNEKLDRKVRYGIVAVAWIVYLSIGLACGIAGSSSRGTDAGLGGANSGAASSFEASASSASASSADNGSTISSDGIDVASAAPHSFPDLEPVTIVDNDDYVIRVEGYGVDPGYIENYGYVLYLENKTDTKVKFTYEHGSFSVDGAMMTPKFLHDVMPGKHASKAYMVFLAEDGIEGFDDLVDVGGIIEVRDSNTYGLIESYPFAMANDDGTGIA